MSQLDLSNVIRVSISGPERGLANLNTSAEAIITDEVPIPADFGVSRTYLNAAAVAADFGSTSETYRLAVIIFSQKRNILTGKGFLIVIPRDQTADAQPATIIGGGPVNLLALTAIDYYLGVALDGAAAADLLIGSIDTTSIATALADLNSTAVAAADLVFSISGELAAAVITLKSTTTGVAKTIEIDVAGTGTDIAPVIDISGSAVGADAGVEKVKDAVLRTYQSVPYFGIVLNEKQTDTLLEELANTVQSMDKLLFVGSNLSADIAGIFTTLSAAGLTHTRCLYYSIAEDDALDFAAGYASRLMSINFDAGNTALTMHLKDITGLVADSGVSQTILDSAKIAGVDVYGNIGVAKVLISGANLYSDQIYTRLALKVRLQISGFNYLATTTTKIPQAEEGMNGLKGAYRAVMALFVGAGVYAPGAWNSSETFGDPADHIRNIAERGYFIFSAPVADQVQTERDARIAPLVQIAAKEAGAIHSSDVTVLVEA